MMLNLKEPDCIDHPLKFSSLLTPRHTSAPAYQHLPMMSYVAPFSRNCNPTGLHRENFLSSNNELCGYIFMCNGSTKSDCYRYRVFGLPAVRLDVVKKIKPRMMLFLFDFDVKLLYGVYTAASHGEIGIEPAAFGGKFSAQVRFEIFNDCLPLPESVFKPVIRSNYSGGTKFRQELSGEQVTNLMAMFRPIDGPTSIRHITRPAVELSASYDQYLAKLPYSGRGSNSQHAYQTQPPSVNPSHASGANFGFDYPPLHAVQPPVSRRGQDYLPYKSEARQACFPENSTLLNPYGSYAALPNDGASWITPQLPTGGHAMAAYWVGVASEDPSQVLFPQQVMPPASTGRVDSYIAAATEPAPAHPVLPENKSQMYQALHMPVHTPSSEVTGAHSSLDLGPSHLPSRTTVREADSMPISNSLTVASYNPVPQGTEYELGFQSGNAYVTHHAVYAPAGGSSTVHGQVPSQNVVPSHKLAHMQSSSEAAAHWAPMASQGPNQMAATPYRMLASTGTVYNYNGTDADVSSVASQTYPYMPFQVPATTDGAIYWPSLTEAAVPGASSTASAGTNQV